MTKEIPTNDVLWMYEMMVMSRYYEDRMVEVYSEGKKPVFNIGSGPVPGEMHLSSGQEPAAVGMCVHLMPSDTVTASHRPHHQAIAKGVNLNKMTAEIFGKETGLSKGKGGHMHLFDPSVKFSCGGIVGGGIPQAAGAALTAKIKGNDSVAVAFIGDGAANQGSFHETLNLAAVWNLPLIVVIEDNSYGISVPKKASTSVPTNDIRASAYGIPGAYVPNNDPLEMYHVSQEAVTRARNGDGPSVIEIETYRYLGHFQGDPELYRDKQEVPNLRKKDPIPLLKEYILNNGLATLSQLDELEKAAKQFVDDAYAFARESAYPLPEQALEDVFS